MSPVLYKYTYFFVNQQNLSIASSRALIVKEKS